MMSPEDTKILELTPFVIYADLEFSIEKIDGSKSNPENSSTAKVSEHIPSVISMPTILPFKATKNKQDVYRSKYCLKKFSESLTEHVMKIIKGTLMQI